MTRRGKIARLPKEIREGLNRRLENGEPGVRLIEWLNGLPEVIKVLAEDFEGVPISDMNLSYWKNGGFLDWQAQQKAESMLERWQIEEPDGALSGRVGDSLKERLMVHYAAALDDAIADTDEKAHKRVKRLGRSLRDVVGVRRHDLARERDCERAELERERLVLQRERLELQRAKLKSQHVLETGKEPAPSHEERAEMVKRMLEEL